MESGPRIFGLFGENFVTAIPFVLRQTVILRDEQRIFKRLLEDWGLTAHEPTEMETGEDTFVVTASEEGLQITQLVKQTEAN